MKNNRSLLTLSLMLALGATAAFGQTATVASVNNQRIDAKQAAILAKSYREKAAAELKKAEQHEAEAERLKPRGYNPMAHKWPTFANAQSTKQKSLAMQARRAADEATRLAVEHERIANAGETVVAPADGQN